MKIALCGSMIFSKKIIEIEKNLLEQGHTVVIPEFTREYAQLKNISHIHEESARNKIDHDLIRGYFKEIKNNDAVLVINEKKNNISGYIGGNSLIEMAFAHVLNKKIFLLNPIPKISYQDEIIAMQPTVINSDFNKIE